MSPEILVLGVISGLRPATSQAAVIALLRAPPRAARRSLLAFTIAGLASSVAIGLIVLLVFDDTSGAWTGPTVFSVADVVAGFAALGFAAGIQRGRILRSRASPPERPESGLRRRLRRPSAATAAAAGIATHVPGLIYLVALNAIAAERSGPVDAAVAVGTYNVLWFVIPLAALVLAIRSPAAAAAYLDRLTGWARQNQERVLVALFGALGVYLTAKGILNLA